MFLCARSFQCNDAHGISSAHPAIMIDLWLFSSMDDFFTFWFCQSFCFCKLMSLSLAHPPKTILYFFGRFCDDEHCTHPQNSFLVSCTNHKSLNCTIKVSSSRNLQKHNQSCDLHKEMKPLQARRHLNPVLPSTLQWKDFALLIKGTFSQRSFCNVKTFVA